MRPLDGLVNGKAVGELVGGVIARLGASSVGGRKPAPG
jgi:hypothetical protein